MTQNFSGISSSSKLGKILRWPLRLISPNQVVRVVQGPIKGEKWIIGSGVHGYWLGSFEREKCRLFQKFVQTGDIVYDLGAHVGYYTLIASNLVGASGKVISFEPNPENLNYLKAHIGMNHISNVQVIDAAVASYSGEAFFAKGSNTSEGNLSTEKGQSIKVISLDDYLAANPSFIPNVMKIDVEGGEREVLYGAEKMLKSTHPVLFLATHSPGLLASCLEFLSGYGYTWEMIGSDEVLAATPQLFWQAGGIQ